MSFTDFHENRMKCEQGTHKKMWLTSAHRGFVGDTGLHENTLAAFYRAYENGADMIETDARMAADGVLVCNHDPDITVEGVTYIISATDSKVLKNLTLSNDALYGRQGIPTLEEVLHLAYHTGLIVNIDMKDGGTYAEELARTVVRCGMIGKVIYATNGSGAETMKKIIAVDPEARFIDSPENFTKDRVSVIEDYRKRCFAYTEDASDESVSAIRESGCMLALITITDGEVFDRVIRQHPDMCEYVHTADFKMIEKEYFKNLKLY